MLFRSLLSKNVVRMQMILAFTGSEKISEYRLGYTVGTATARSSLSTLLRCNGQGGCLPQVSISLETSSTVSKSWTWSGAGLAAAGWKMADLFGEGRQVYMTHDGHGSFYATRLNADGTAQNWTWSGVGLAAAGWQMADLFGDGRQVYVTHDGHGSFYEIGRAHV